MCGDRNKFANKLSYRNAWEKCLFECTDDVVGNTAILLMGG